MTIEHKNIADADRHEPKGLSTATAGRVYVAGGSDTGSWTTVGEEGIEGLGTGTLGQVVTSDGAGGFTFLSMPHGRISFINIATPYTLTFPGVGTYGKLAPTTVASGDSTLMTEGTNARLTYTGTPTKHFHIAATMSVAQAAGANRDIRLAIYKNGSIIPSTETVQTTTSAIKVSTAIHADIMMATGDYLEVWAANDGASGDITLYTYYLFAMGMYQA